MALFVDIEKKLGDFHLQVSFQAENGVLALLGASGCGKSLTLRCIAGIDRPDRGRIILDGRTLFDKEKHLDLPPQKRRIGYLFQQYALFPNMTVEQNIACGVRDRAVRENVVREAVRRMRLEGTEKKKPHQLSGGQQQRAALARILASEPEVLLLDEPFSALDSHLRFQMEQEVREVIREFGGTVLLVSHDRDEVFRLSDHVAVMKDGRIETAGPKHEVFAAPATVNGARMTGCKNISPVRVLDGKYVFARDWGLSLRTVGDTSGVTHVGIRMHDIIPGKEAAGANGFRCRVEEEIENPFSVTVMLRPLGEENVCPLGMELSKEAWAVWRQEEIWAELPPEKIILLRG